MQVLPRVYTISPSNDSTLAFQALQLGPISRKKKHTLFFENFAGELHLGGDDLTPSQMRLTIDATSIICRDVRISEKERRRVTEFARDALDPKRYPEIQYHSTNIRARPLRGFVATGVLQIRSITRQVNINLTSNQRAREEFQLDGDATLRLSDFDLPRPSALFGLIRTSDEIIVHLLLWAGIRNASVAEASRS